MALNTSATSSSDKILYLLKTRGPLTAQSLAGLLDMTSMGARQHLQQLESHGLVSTFDRKEKVGRPSRYWELTRKAHTRFPDRHSDLTLTLIENVREVFGEKGLKRLINKREVQTESHYRQELQKLPSLESRLQRLAELRSQEGYLAEVVSQGKNCWLFIENHCAICAAAAQCQEFCRSEIAIFRRCLEANVERSEYIIDGARRCTYWISTK